MPQPYNPQLELENGRVDWLNVKALGARGDGVTDDAPIFAAAGLLAAQPPGQLIYIPAGTYRLGSNVVFAGGVQWLNMGTITGPGALSGGTQVSFGASSLINPMTTSGDLIYGAGAGVPTRLGIGLAGQVLTVAAGLPAWQNPVTGFANPMTAAGDLITGGAGGAAQRLPAGASGQVLGIAAGAPAWLNNPAGFANPMSARGDLILGGTGGVAGRLPIGAPGQLLAVSGGTAAWVSTASTVVTPSGDTTGALDQAAIAAALNSLPGGGTVVLGPGDFYVKASTTPVAGFSPPANTCIFLPQQTTAGTGGGGPLSLRGQAGATVIHVVGAGVTGLYAHRSSGYGAQFGLNPADQTAGFVADLVISGQNPAGTQTATGACIGLDIGDGWALKTFNVVVANFAGTGSIGFRNALQVFWNEKQHHEVHSLNNDTAAVLTTTITTDSTHHSSEYNYIDITMFCNIGQNGVIVDGVNLGGTQVLIKGNMTRTTSAVAVPNGSYGTPLAALAIVNQVGTPTAGEVRQYFGQIWMKVEGNNGVGNPANLYPYGFYSDGTGKVQQSMGFIGHSLTSAQLNGCEFSFMGGLAGDTNLSQAFPGPPGSNSTITTQPAVPASGTAQQNYGPAFQVFVTCPAGGTITGVSINGVATGASSSTAGQTLGGFFVGAGASITLNYTGTAPTWAWCPAAQMSF